MAETPSNARRRELGAELRRWRERTKLTGHDLARKMGVPASTVSRLENGKIAPTETNVTMYLGHCGAPSDEIARIFGLEKAIEHNYLLCRNGIRNLILHETTARRFTAVAQAIIPGLLQTEGYARAIMQYPRPLSEEEVERRVKLRMDRQQVLKGWNPPTYTCYLYEAALQCTVGDHEVMNEQMLHLLFLTGRPNITIRMVPMRKGRFVAATRDLILMEFASHGPMLHVAGELASLMIDDKSAIKDANLMLKQVADNALGEQESQELLAGAAYDYDRPEEHHERTHLAEEQPQ